jgi:hypothetical protein
MESFPSHLPSPDYKSETAQESLKIRSVQNNSFNKFMIPSEETSTAHPDCAPFASRELYRNVS